MPNTREKEKLAMMLEQTIAQIGRLGVPRSDARRMAVDLMHNCVTVQEWISVKERLPVREVKVLTYGVYGFSVNYLDKFSGKWRGVNGRPQWITHWMPLPEPPKGE